MLTTDRRMQEGARDLAIALNLGRAEEALHRLCDGHSLTGNDRSFFVSVADLFRDATEGYVATSAAVHGSADQNPPRSGALRAMRLLIPLLHDEAANEAPPSFFERFATLAGEVAAGETPPV